MYWAVNAVKKFPQFVRVGPIILRAVPNSIFKVAFRTGACAFHPTLVGTISLSHRFAVVTKILCNKNGKVLDSLILL